MVMSKRVLIIETSLRNDSNSDRLAESFAQGARDGWIALRRLYSRGKFLPVV